MLLSIVVPAYNEEAKILSSLDEIVKAVVLLNITYEIIVIDDGSNDGTYLNVLEYIKDCKNIFLYKNKKNIGLGATYKKGIEISKGDYVTWVPADLSHDFNSLLDTYKYIGNNDIIIPYPINPEVRNLNRVIISYLFIKIVNLLTNNKIIYYNGLSIFKKNLIESMQIYSDGFTFQAEILVKLLKNNVGFIEVPTKILERSHGTSKAFTSKNFIQALFFFILCYKHRRLF